MPSQFVRVNGAGTVYQKLGNGLLDPIANPEEFAQRAGTTDIAGNTQVINSLNDAYAPEIQAQVNGQYDPQLALDTQQSQSDTQQAQSNAQRLKDSIAEIFKQKALQDPLAKMGVYSGAQDIYNTGQNVKQVTQADQDLTATLTNIANRLKTQQQGAVTGKAGLTSQLLQQFQGNNQSYLDAQAAKAFQQKQFDAQQALQKSQLQTDANKVNAVDLGGSIALMRPDGTIIQTIKKSAAPGTGTSLSTPAGKNAALLSAVQSELGTGNYTATGEAGKQSREQLIGKLSGAFAGTGITDQMIKDAVYGNDRNNTEGAYIPGQSSTQTAAQQQVDSNYATAAKALQTVRGASALINTANDKLTPAYAGQLYKNMNAALHGDQGAYTDLSQGQAAILTTIHALLNVGRITDNEMKAIQFPSGGDTKEQANKKLDFIQSLLDRGAPQQGPSAPVPAAASQGGWSIIK